MWGIGKTGAMKCISATFATFALAMLATPAVADEASRCKLDRVASFPVIMDGPRASIRVSINGRETRLKLSTAAWFNFMAKAEAVNFGLQRKPLPDRSPLHERGYEMTTVHDFGIAGATLHDVQFLVGGDDSGEGSLSTNFFGTMATEFDLANGAINLLRETACNQHNLAYWAKDATVLEARLVPNLNMLDRRFVIEVTINGHAFRARLDTDSPVSLLSSTAARKAGLEPDGPQALAPEMVAGLGPRKRASWIVRAQSLAIGEEQIHNTPIRVFDNQGYQQDADMLLGMDFLMAHHLLISPVQNRAYLTYNGGEIFAISNHPEADRKDTHADNIETATAGEPTTADGFAGRGSARFLRDDATGAVADYTAAIALAPQQADLFIGRARALWKLGKRELAVMDIGAALALNPGEPHGLLLRGQIRFVGGDRAGAQADVEAALPALGKGTLDTLPAIGLLERLGLADRALTLLDQVIALHRDDAKYPALLNSRAWNRALANADLDQARRDIEAALGKAGLNPTMLDTRALVRFRHKDFGGTIADENTALSRKPQMAPALYLRGLAKLASGDDAGGRADVAAAREIAPKVGELYATYGLTAP